MAKGLIDEDHSLSIGASSAPAARSSASSCAPPTWSSARLRHHRSRVRGVDRRLAAGADRHQAADVAPSVHLVHQVTGTSIPAGAARGAAAAPTGGPRRCWLSTGAGFRAALRPASELHGTCRDRCRAPRPAHGGILGFDVGAHPPDREPVDGLCAQDLQITNGWSSMGWLPARSRPARTS
jgi:hypothetical protein